MNKPTASQGARPVVAVVRTGLRPRWGKVWGGPIPPPPQIILPEKFPSDRTNESTLRRIEACEYYTSKIGVDEIYFEAIALTPEVARATRCNPMWDEDRKGVNVPNILLVEDDDQLRVMLKLLLTNAGYEVSEAINGTRVCDMHQQQRFDLVITDLVMPDTEGLTVLRELRRIDQDVKIIAMSGGRQGKGEEYLRIAQKLGAHLLCFQTFGSQSS